MGWSLSPFVFQKLTEIFTDHLRGPGVVNPFSLGPLVYRHKVGPQGFKTVASSSTPAHMS